MVALARQPALAAGRRSSPPSLDAFLSTTQLIGTNWENPGLRAGKHKQKLQSGDGQVNKMGGRIVDT